MRKRTFQDKKFSAGDANSQAFVDNWEATFGDKTRDAATKQDAESPERK
jgi:hypothetical protein